MSVSDRVVEITSSERLRWAISGLVALSIISVAVASFATTALKLDLESLVANSEEIVEGEVVEVDSRVEEGKVFTYVTLEVKDGLKGKQKGETVRIKYMGGRTDELATRVPGMPHFNDGEQAIVFLERPTPDKPRVVTGMSQGKFEVAIGPDNYTRYVVPRLGDISLLEPAEADGEDEDGVGESLSQDEPQQGNYEPTRPAQLYERVVPLDVFKDKVREVIRDQGAE